MIDNLTSKMVERKINLIKANFVRYNQDPEEYQLKIVKRLDILEKCAYKEIKSEIKTLIIDSTVIMLLFFLLLKVEKHANSTIGTFGYNPFYLILVFCCIFILLHILMHTSKILSPILESLNCGSNRYHNWFIIDEKVMIVDWWDAKTPIIGKRKYVKRCSICGAEKIEIVEY
ncbi:hypothetical protein [uncultured Methanolobus sp.]|uniref:hypothetical protein n=1 Tax=uncultured Methanolobus sp. TaxID=218300 RepID=UPI0037486CD7